MLRLKRAIRRQQKDNRTRVLGTLLTGLATVLVLALPVQAQWIVEAETGLVWSGYNDVRVPNSTGTMFSLSKELSTARSGFGRVRLSHIVGQRHRFSLLVAPLQLEATGSVATPISFAGSAFSAHSALIATYRFNSYRFTYRYSIDDAGRLRVAVGATAKVRDALIRLQAKGLRAETSNVGLVPLLSLRCTWQFAPRAVLLVDGDALAAPQGRAEDVLLALAYAPSPKVQLYAGYRLLEGGAEVEQVYNFALFHYLCLGAAWTM